MSWDCYTHTTPTARKAHRCHACFHTIQPGEQYERTKGIWDGEAETWKQCLICRPDEDGQGQRPKVAGQIMDGILWVDDENCGPPCVWVSHDGQTWVKK